MNESNKAIGLTGRFSVYLGTGTSLGTATVELPDFEAITETLTGAGLGGELEMPVVGLFKPMTVKLSFNKKTSNYIKLLAPEGHHLDLRISTQGYKGSEGKFTHTPERIVLRTLPKKSTLGKLEVGKPQGNEIELGVIYVKLVIDGKDAIEYDKLNYKYVVDGVDYMAKIRSNIGMEG
ncbi:phage major tail tube protein [Maridesulfovibrio ferrireducens]|uniref:phage major tail tube protein n=1 Tax=Maridesulfovibrio ferrireducens TaxID=246191 RepID=UPI001A1DB927|nr:phage major tail tube protein [Maridesulfovibrio ferrireducens]MBI9112249.1 phage major tail tube protein [Maridesulfovibrio ferrireducens]